MASANPGWDYYATITIDDAKVPSTQANFPVLISLTNDSLKLSPTGKVRQADGGDIVFTNDGNTVKYNHEIEKYDGTAGTVVAWVNIPSLLGTGSGDTVIWMWYGNADCADQWNIEATWDSNFAMVQHLSETTGQHIDSTSNSNDSTTVQVTTQGSAVGKVNGADNFDGTDDYVSVPYAVSLDPSAAITLEAWVNWTVAGGDGTNMIVENGGAKRGLKIDSSTQYVEFDCEVGPPQSLTSTTTLGSGWHHVVATYDGTTMIIYINATQSGTKSISGTMDSQTGTTDIGGSGTADSFEGDLDEARISTTARSADWITTSHNNQSDQVVGSGHFIISVVYDTATGGLSPVPELPTIVLMAVGLVGMGVCLWLEKRRQRMVLVS